MIAELLEAFGNRLHPRIVVSFQLWLFPSRFGTTYLSRSVNPLVFLYQKGYKKPSAVGLSNTPTYCHWPPQDGTRLLNCSGEEKFGKFFTYHILLETVATDCIREHRMASDTFHHAHTQGCPQCVLRAIRDTTATNFRRSRTGPVG